MKKIDKLDMAAIDLLILKNGMENPPLLEPFQGVLSPLAYFLETALIFCAPWLQSNPTVVFVIKKIEIIRLGDQKYMFT